MLVVDDEDVVLFAMQAYFAARGFRVDCSATFADAHSRLERGAYAAVISDLRLSGSDGQEGLDLLRHVRAQGFDSPFVLLTGYGTGGVIAEAERLGVSAIIIKPRPLHEIAQVVLTLLGTK